MIAATPTTEPMMRPPRVHRFFYDTEFLDAGPSAPIEFLSIGVVHEHPDMPMYYAVNATMNQERVTAHPFLRDQVWPHLPLIGPPGTRRHRLNIEHPDVRPPALIAAELRQYLFADYITGDRIELWADYAGYDHVVLAHLFGRMDDWPAGLPMFTRDVQQLAADLGVDTADLPNAESLGRVEHHALGDAKVTRARWLTLAGMREDTSGAVRLRLSALLGYPEQDHEPPHWPRVMELLDEMDQRAAAAGRQVDSDPDGLGAPDGWLPKLLSGLGKQAER